MNSKIKIIPIQNFSENLATRDIGLIVRNKIISELSNNSNDSIIVLDFNKVDLVTHQCADEIFGKLVLEIGLKEFKEKVNIRNIDETSATIIKYVIARRLASTNNNS